MTGGGTGRCLQTTEAGGMGEGWSDAMAEYVMLSDSSEKETNFKLCADGPSTRVPLSWIMSSDNMSPTIPLVLGLTHTRPLRK